MNGSSPEVRRWPPRRWAYSVLVALLAQVGLLAWLGRGTGFRSATPPAGMTISLAADPWMTEQIRRLPTFRDPTVFALSSLEGFSGSAWLRFVPWENSLTYWSEPARWLDLDTNRLARFHDQLLITNRMPPLLVADRPIIRITGADAFVANQPVPQESTLLIEGPLAKRSLQSSPSLPSWPNRDLLTNSVVQVMVLPSGEAFSTVLLSGSGVAEADRHALTFATTGRFNPLQPAATPDSASGPLTSGRMIFRWHTLPPDANRSPGSPP
jgi:hypothetical protein